MGLDVDAAASAVRLFAATAEKPGAALAFLAGGGGWALIRAHDWSSTPLGAPENWPQSLKLAVRIMLTSRQPFWIGWGPRAHSTFTTTPTNPSSAPGIPGRSAGPPPRCGARSGTRSAPAPNRDGRRHGHLCGKPAPSDGAQRLSGGDLLHLLLQPHRQRGRLGRRHHLPTATRPGA